MSDLTSFATTMTLVIIGVLPSQLVDGFKKLHNQLKNDMYYLPNALQPTVSDISNWISELNVKEQNTLDNIKDYFFKIEVLGM